MLIVFGKIIGIGFVFGFVFGYLFGLFICKDWILYYLFNIVVLIVILGVFVVFNYVVYEFGFLVVIIFGMVLVNMKDVDVEDIFEFKEIFSVLFILGLFILFVMCLNL